MTDYVWATFMKEGIHRYPEAGTNPVATSRCCINLALTIKE